MKPPVVTVVVPTYRRTDYLDRAIRSVRAQTFEDWELVVVDDNGEDSPCRDAVRDVMSAHHDDERIGSIEHATNSGGAVARNSGIQSSRGRYVAFLDDDDEWRPNKLERQLARFRAAGDELGLVYTACEVVDDIQGTTYVDRPECRGDLRHRLLGKNVVGTTSTVLCPKHALLAVGGFDPALEAYQDHDLYLRLAASYEFDCVDEPLVVRHVHSGDRITTRIDGALEASERVLEKHHAAMSEHPARLSEFLAKQGSMYLDHGDHRQAVHKFAAAIRAHPPGTGLWPYLAVALAGPAAYALARSVRSRVRSISSWVRKRGDEMLG